MVKVFGELRIAAQYATSIWHGDQLFGMIVVGNLGGDAMIAQRIIAMVADLTGVGLAAAQRISKIRHEAQNDPLTGLPNKRSLLPRARSEFERAIAYGTELSLAMLDVDHFKNYNDQNGHQAGDEVLKQISALIRSATRRTDLVARYGGEEFTVLLVGADRAQAFHHAERIRKTVAETILPFGDQQPLGRVSLSIGVATASADAKQPEMLFEAADRALYQAKQLGRDRVVAYDGPPITSSQNVSVELAPSPSQTEQNLRRAIARGTADAEFVEEDAAEENSATH